MVVGWRWGDGLALGGMQLCCASPTTCAWGSHWGRPVGRAGPVTAAPGSRVRYEWMGPFQPLLLARVCPQRGARRGLRAHVALGWEPCALLEGVLPGLPQSWL